MTAAIYARYSSELQDARSVDDQCARLRDQMKRDGVQDAGVMVFADEATSGAQWDRPGLQALLRAVADGKISTLYVESIDRLSRDIGDASRIRKQLEFRGVHLRSIGDGISLGGGASSLAYDIKSIIGEMYLKDLGDKTLRGLQARARDGRATGGRTYGYVTTADGIAIEPTQALVIRRIFGGYATGASTAKIATMLNAEQIEPPRSKSTLGGGGWMASCVREMLRNARYIGDWSFGRRQWRKDPETRRRTPIARDASEVIRIMRPELAIIDHHTWDAVQLRHADAAVRYGASVRTPKRPTSYLLSTLLVCDMCGSPMEIAGGSPGRERYRCSRNRKRGTCSNALSVREANARASVLTGLRRALTSPATLEHVRTYLAEWLGDGARATRGEIADRTGRLRRTEERIRGLVLMQAEGDRSDVVVELRRDLEAQACAERDAIERLRSSAQVITLISPTQVERCLDLDQILMLDIHAAREGLRGLLERGEVRMAPREDGRYVARFAVLPVGPIVAPDIVASGRTGATMSRSGCGGVQPALRMDGSVVDMGGSGWDALRIEVAEEVA